MEELNGYSFEENNSNVVEETGGERSYGYIKAQRAMVNYPLFNNNAKKSRFEAWLDLLFKATYKPSKLYAGNSVITIELDQILTSQDALAREWRWSRHAVRDFLKFLEMGKYLVLQTATKYTIITLLESDIYTTYSTSKGHNLDIKRTSKGHQKDTYKKDKKEIKENKEGEIALPEKNLLGEEKPSAPPLPFPLAESKVHVEKKGSVPGSVAAERVICLLNSVLGSRFKPNTANSQKFIIARIKEGFSEEDLNSVVVNQQKLWGHDEKMKAYLRPETLFGNKFEGYLNSVPKLVIKHDPAPNFKNCDSEEDFKIKMEEYNKKYNLT